MPRPKTALNKAAEEFKCPVCEVGKQQSCINAETGLVVATHRTRQNLVCQETFLSFPPVLISGGQQWSMFCARRAGHKSQHQTPDKRLTWSQGFGDAERDLLNAELMANTG